MKIFHRRWSGDLWFYEAVDGFVALTAFYPHLVSYGVFTSNRPRSFFKYYFPVKISIPCLSDR